MPRAKAQGLEQPAADAPGSEQGALESVLGHRFRDPALLERALTHSSWVYETAGPDSGIHDNETLEFLGDAVLGLVVAESLWTRFPARSEGELTQMRSSVVSRRYLGLVGTRLELGRWLRLGPTAEANRGRENAALFSNTVEALLAALYLDGGLRAVRRFVDRHLLAGIFTDPAFSLAAAGESSAGAEPRPAAPAGAFPSALGDWKSALKERLDAEGGSAPEYCLLAETGPAHQRSFRVEVRIAGEPIAEAEGTSKKRAQQEAARLALRRRDGLPDNDPPPKPRPDAPPHTAGKRAEKTAGATATQPPATTARKTTGETAARTAGQTARVRAAKTAAKEWKRRRARPEDDAVREPARSAQQSAAPSDKVAVGKAATRRSAPHTAGAETPARRKAAAHPDGKRRLKGSTDAPLA